MNSWIVGSWKSRNLDEDIHVYMGQCSYEISAAFRGIKSKIHTNSKSPLLIQQKYFILPTNIKIGHSISIGKCIFLPSSGTVP